MNQPHSIFYTGFLFLLCSILSPFSLPAQPGLEDNTLHIPPKLKVKVIPSVSSIPDILQVPENASTIDHIVVSRIRNSEETAMLPMIFFDQGSSAIPERYQKFSGTFDARRYSDRDPVEKGVDNVLPSRLLKYYELLNIIGYRMTRFPLTTIGLEGGYSTEPGEEKMIAEERAEVVKEYLETVWDIAPERLSLLPPRKMCDSADHLFKQEEARRVLIHANDWELLHPVRYDVISDKASFICFSIHIDPWVEAEDIAEIELVMALGDQVLGVTHIPGDPTQSRYNFRGLWFLLRSHEALESYISVQAVVHSNKGPVRGSNKVMIPVREEEKTHEELLMERYAGRLDDDERESMQEEMRRDYEKVMEEHKAAEEEENPYDGPILFFESADTSLSGLQKVMIDQHLQEYLDTASYWSDKRLSITLTGTGEAGENPEAVDGHLASIKAHQQSLQGSIDDFMNDQSFKVSLYILSETAIDTEDHVSQEFYKELWNTMLGEKASELGEIQERYKAVQSRERFAGELRDEIDTFLMRRALSVGDYITEQLGSDRIDTMMVRSDFYGSLPYEYAPEERFYKRLVEIRIDDAEWRYDIDSELDEFEEMEYIESDDAREGEHE